MIISRKIVEKRSETWLTIKKDCHDPTGARVFVNPAEGGMSQKD